MRFEVFHTGLLGRPDIIAVDMIHHPGLWGMCFSHHPPNNNHPRYAADTTTAGVLRFLEAAHEGRDGLRMDALAEYVITTHHLDADAVLPVWALLYPEAALARRDLLERVARSGDLFLYLDATSARINATIEGLHWRLRGQGKAGDRIVEDQLTRDCFDWLLPRLQDLLDDPEPYREYWETPLRTFQQERDYLLQPGRITEHWEAHLSLIETDHDPDTAALNTVSRNDLLLVWRTDSPQRRLDVRPAIAWYELTSVPHRPRYDLADLAERLNAAEGVPTWTHQPGPVSLSAACSRLSQAETLTLLSVWLQSHSETQLPTAYRADVQQVFRLQDRHATFDSHRRFTLAEAVRYRPGAPYEGLHLLNPEATRHDSETLHLEGGKKPLPFTVADDFYWNRADPEPLLLEVTYRDVAPGAFRLEVDTWENPLLAAPPVTLCGDGQIRTAHFPLPNARLGATQPQGADFRLTRTPGTPLALRELALRKKKELSW